MTTLNRNDALDFLRQVDIKESDNLTQHPFKKALDNNNEFNKALKKARGVLTQNHQKSDDQLSNALIVAVARATLIYNSYSDPTFNQATRNQMLPLINKLEETLEYSDAFKCEFEQIMFLDMLAHLKKSPTPARSFKTKSKQLFQINKATKEIAMWLMSEEIPLSPALVTHLVAAIDNNVTPDTIKSQLRRMKSSLKEWEDYSIEFFNSVFVPYIELRDKESKN